MNPRRLSVVLIVAFLAGCATWAIDHYAYENGQADAWRESERTR